MFVPLPKVVFDILFLELRGEHGRKVKIHTPDVKSQDELEVRTMQDSYQEAIIPLGSDLARRQEYVNFFQMAR